MENKVPDKKVDIENKHEPVNILGLSTEELAGLSTAEVVNNETAIKMLMHYYKQLTTENLTLKNEKNTLDTYVSAFETKQTNSAAGSLFLVISNIVIGFGVNLLSGTAENSRPGWMLLSVGVFLALAGLYFNFLKDKN
jgi:hypothetical protein